MKDSVCAQTSTWMIANLSKRRVNILSERDPSLRSLEDENHLSCPPIRNKEKRGLPFSPPHSHKHSIIKLYKADLCFHSTTTNLHWCPRRTKVSKKNTTALVSSWPPRLSNANKSHWWCTMSMRSSFTSYCSNATFMTSLKTSWYRSALLELGYCAP